MKFPSALSGMLLTLTFPSTYTAWGGVVRVAATGRTTHEALGLCFVNGV